MQWQTKHQANNITCQDLQSNYCTYHCIDNPYNKWTYDAWIVFYTANWSISTNREVKIP